MSPKKEKEKCKCTSSPYTTCANKTTCCRPSGKDGLFAIAASLESVANGLDEGISVVMTSLQQQTAVIKAVETDEEMSENEFAAAVEMFQEKSHTLWEFQSLDEIKTLVYIEIYILSRLLS